MPLPQVDSGRCEAGGIAGEVDDASAGEVIELRKEAGLSERSEALQDLGDQKGRATGLAPVGVDEADEGRARREIEWGSCAAAEERAAQWEDATARHRIEEKREGDPERQSGEADGTKIRLSVDSADKKRDITLVLKNLI